MPSTSARAGESITTWYAAHSILFTKFLDGIQDSYPIWENIILINAETSDEAYAIAEKKGKSEAETPEGGGYTYNGRPAVWVYAGTRKLNECLEYFDPKERAVGGMEEHGTEVTYSPFVLADEDALQKMLANRDVMVLYEGIEPEDGAASGSSEELKK